jgi:hypothetical protein
MPTPQLAPEQQSAKDRAEIAAAEEDNNIRTSGKQSAVEPAPAGAVGGNAPAGKSVQDILKTVPTAPSTQQDIDQILGPYVKQLMNLGPEYGAEMQYLQPYLPSEYSPSTAPTYTGPGAATVNADQNALTTAEEGVNKAVTSQAPPGFGGIANEMQQYEQSLPYQQAIQSGLGYQKYLETYQGLPTDQTNWPTSIQQAYGAISGTDPSGIQNPIIANKDQAAIASNNQNNSVTNPISQPTPVSG